MARTALVIGGTGQIGRAVAKEFLSHGWAVTLSSRGFAGMADDLEGAKVVHLDRAKQGALSVAIGAGCDLLVDTIAFDQNDARQLLGVQDRVGAFAVISSASVYRDDAGRTFDEAGDTGFPDFAAPIRETQTTVDPGPQSYSTRKVALERELLDHATRPVTILRPCAIHGPHSSHPREWWFVKRMGDERKVIPIAYRGESRFHPSAAANIARLIRIVQDHPQTRVLNIADEEAPNVIEIGETIARHVGYEGSLLPLDIGDARGTAAIGATPWSIPGRFVLDTQAATRLGYAPAASYDTAVRNACDWLMQEDPADWRNAFPVLASYPRDLFDYAAEDAWLRENESR